MLKNVKNIVWIKLKAIRYYGKLRVYVMNFILMYKITLSNILLYK